LLFAESGARVFVADRKLDESNREPFSKFSIKEQACDIRVGGQIEGWIQAVLSEVSGIDILINNAGINIDCQIPDMAENDWNS
jgi:NADP-dependent 3-hydroxy acid dehydrogenase YdfG